jgi:hypothetical protein
VSRLIKKENKNYQTKDKSLNTNFPPVLNNCLSDIQGAIADYNETSAS